MRPYDQVREQFDALWQRFPAMLDRYLEHYAAQLQDAEKPNPDPATLREINTLATVLKRVQDGTRALHLDALKLETDKDNGNENPANDNTRFSRILELLAPDDDEDGETGTDAQAL